MDDDDEELRRLEQAAAALIVKGDGLRHSGQLTEAIEAYDAVIARFGEREELLLAELVSEALFNRGVAFDNARRFSEAVASYDVILHRFGKRTELPLVEDVARALCSKAVSTMRQPGRFQEGLAYIVEFYKRFGSHRGPVFDKLSAITRELIDDLSRSRGTSKPNTIETSPPVSASPVAERPAPNPNYLFRQAKKRALKSVLAPAGFTKGKHMFVRHISGHYHGMEYQTSKYGGEYFVNLAFSFDCVLPLSNGKNGNFVPLAGYHLLDCLFHARIGSFLPGRYQDSWGFDELSGPALDAQVAQHARDVLRVLDDTSKKWADPATFLAVFPPDLLREDHRLRIEEYHARQENRPWDRPFPIRECLGKEWTTDDFNLAFGCASIAQRAGKTALAREYLSVAGAIGAEYERQALPAMCDRVGLPFKDEHE